MQHCLHDDIFSHFDRTQLVKEGQTDRQGHSIYCTSIMLCGKKGEVFLDNSVVLFRE